MANESAPAAVGAVKVSPTDPPMSSSSAVSGRTGPHNHRHDHSHALGGAHEHHLRNARALLREVAGLRGRGRLRSSPALLVPGHNNPTVAPLKLPTSSSARELRVAASANLEAGLESVETGRDAEGKAAGHSECIDSLSDAARTESIVLALALLHQAQEAADSHSPVTLTKDSVDAILGGLMSTLDLATSHQHPVSAEPSALSSREVEHQMERLFVSHANVFDEKVQNFIIQNFIQETDYAKAFRSAIRRTSLVKRCLNAMYPSDKLQDQQRSRWNLAFAQRARQSSAEGGALEACPEIQDSETVLAVQQALATISTWEFDLFALAAALPGQTLLVLGNELLNKHELVTHFRTTKTRQLDFLRQIQMKYLPHPYHNAEHAADVAQSLHHFLTLGNIGETVNPRSKCAAIVAAIIHDVGHTSFTNNFHIACNDDLAVQYVYRSPLEHMHCALAFQVMKSTKANVLEGLTRIEQMEVRTLITDMVLATDNSVHAAYLAKLDGLICRATDATAWTLSANPDDERLVLQMALHAADVSNPAKTLDQCRLWAHRILAEFHQQGDRERELELPVSIGHDRENPIPLEKMQAGFILGIVRPLFAVFCRLPCARLGHCLSQLDQNLAYWQNRIANLEV